MAIVFCLIAIITPLETEHLEPIGEILPVQQLKKFISTELLLTKK